MSNTTHHSVPKRLQGWIAKVACCAAVFASVIHTSQASEFDSGKCGDPTTPIHAIQGPGSASPMTGGRVSVEAIVVGDYQHTQFSRAVRSELAGFFIQEEDADTDNDGRTSEGLFVHDPKWLTDIHEGDQVRVTGTVTEYHGLTELDKVTSITICRPGQAGLITAARIDLPVPHGVADIDAYYEPLEGMLVAFRDVMTVTDHSDLARYGQLVLSEGGRLRQYSQDGQWPLNEADWAAAREDQARRSIRLDDFNDQQNIDPVFHPQPGGFSVNNSLRTGAITTNLQGVLEYRHDEWRIHPQKSRAVTFINPGRPDVPQMGANVLVGSMNVLNYFNGNGAGGGFPTPRGADSAAELLRQTDKTVRAIVQMNPDVLGLMEIENDADTQTDALAYLVRAINQAAGEALYDFIRAGASGAGDDIKVALIYQPQSVSPVGSPRILKQSSFIDPMSTGDQKNRPALAQTFAVTDSANPDFGEAFTVVALHLKSKGSSCGKNDDSLIQGNCNETRTRSAMELIDWLRAETDQTAGASDPRDPDVIVLGDFNAYYQEDPMQVFYAAGYANLLPQHEYTFVYDGLSGSLDHALASPSMAAQVISSAVWHSSADESALLDYNDPVQDVSEQTFETKPSANVLYRADAFRSSDHDPLILGLDLGGSSGEAR